MTHLRHAALRHNYVLDGWLNACAVDCRASPQPCELTGRCACIHVCARVGGGMGGGLWVVGEGADHKSGRAVWRMGGIVNWRRRDAVGRTRGWTDAWTYGGACVRADGWTIRVNVALLSWQIRCCARGGREARRCNPVHDVWPPRLQVLQMLVARVLFVRLAVRSLATFACSIGSASIRSRVREFASSPVCPFARWRASPFASSFVPPLAPSPVH